MNFNQNKFRFDLVKNGTVSRKGRRSANQEKAAPARSLSRESRQRAADIVQGEADEILYDDVHQIESKDDLFAAIGDTSAGSRQSRQPRQRGQPVPEQPASPIQHYKAGEDIYAVPKSRTQSRERNAAQKSRTQSAERRQTGVRWNLASPFLGQPHCNGLTSTLLLEIQVFF